MNDDKIDPDDLDHGYVGHLDPRLKPVSDADLRRLVNDFRRSFDAADTDDDTLRAAYRFRDAIGECEGGA